MRRKASGSETDNESSASPKKQSASSNGKKNTDEKSDKLLQSYEDSGLHSNTPLKEEQRAGSNIGKAEAWKRSAATGTSLGKTPLDTSLVPDHKVENMLGHHYTQRMRSRSPWSCSILTFATTLLSAALLGIIAQSFLSRQIDPKGCAMSYMRAAFAKFSDFDTEHTRFASKYSLYLYREGGIDEDTRVKGIPVLFIPGNAGSYKQVRPIAAEAAYYFHDVIQHDTNALGAGKRALDFFSVDFNEDITAWHGQTLLDQAEYLNEAVAYILSLYHNPHRSIRDPELPDPSSVILVGHSMGGIVARTMLTMPNYQANTINTILTLSTPHARAPVSIDAEIVATYATINKYWRKSYAAGTPEQNPLSHMTLISIAGGALDTIVPSDYANVASLVPETHGFTVFTSTMPNVWTGMDHLAIMWCDQLRKSLVRALYDVVDVGRPWQTRPRSERIQAFRRRFLTGMEPVVEKKLPVEEPKTLLTLEDDSNTIEPQSERFVLRSLGQSDRPKVHLMPIPPQGAPEGRKFTLLTDQKLDALGDTNNLEILFCSLYPLQAGQASSFFSMNVDLPESAVGSTRLACKNAASDVIVLPASTTDSKNAFDGGDPFFYLQYNLGDLAELQFVAVVDKAVELTPGWVIAEFSSSSEARIRNRMGLSRLLSNGMRMTLPPNKPLMTEIRIPALHSSLLAYHLTISSPECGNVEKAASFAPLLRQYITQPHESKYFVNARSANINLHGVSPYMPPALEANLQAPGVTLQIWSDPTCNCTMEVALKVDVFGSAGKLVMRYRTVFAAFPLVIIALVLRKQFKVYDDLGVFISFSESMDRCLRTSIPMLFLSLTFFAIWMSQPAQDHWDVSSQSWLRQTANATQTATDFAGNDLLLGSQDLFFWFLLPLFGLLTVGVCIAVNYATLVVTYIFTLAYTQIRSVSLSSDGGRRTATSFTVTSVRHRLITITLLLLAVSTAVPYQFAYAILCVVQLATCVRSLRLAEDTHSAQNVNFSNYTHSLLLVLLWVLPINLPVLVVWVRNLTVHWLTPFTSHHNVLSVMPYILLVETLSTGRMVPRMTGRTRHVTNLLLLGLAFYAAVWGVTYAYRLHHIVNGLCAWLVVLHLMSDGVLRRLKAWVEGGHIKKRP
ncbi:GPI inositol deacylase [Elasticomyces elasticus]|nr:GPI inositol deacylase [Elasticomyces elasticus]